MRYLRASPPTSTQFSAPIQGKPGGPALLAVYDVLERLSANMDIIAFDDTPIKILEGRLTDKGTKTIKGHGSVFVCNDVDSNKIIVLYRLDFEHADKHLLKLLQYRDSELPEIVCVCDGPLCYESCLKNGVVVCNCNVHPRRKFFQHDPEGKDFYSVRLLLPVIV